MFGSAKEVIADLSKRLADNYEKLVQTNARFDELRTSTKDAIDEYKRLLERQEDKIEQIEKDRIRVEAELMTKISSLEGRLTALSEQALHAVARDAAHTIMAERIPAIVPANPQSDGNNQYLSDQSGENADS
ncbi:MAG: hypothetical protein AAF943_17235 [Pseudomonadota bacterium]